VSRGWTVDCMSTRMPLNHPSLTTVTSDDVFRLHIAPCQSPPPWWLATCTGQKGLFLGHLRFTGPFSHCTSSFLVTMYLYSNANPV